jgi:hypothetical protein
MRQSYIVQTVAIGQIDENLGGPTQMAIFRRAAA